MILLEAGRRSERGFDAKMIFAAQLSDRGHAVVIDEETVPDKFERSQKYEAAPYLARIDGPRISTVLMIGSEDIDDATLARLRGLGLGPDVRVVAIGRFPDRQSEIGARSRLAYALGREPGTFNISEHYKGDLHVTALSPLAALEIPAAASIADVPEVFLFLPAEWLDEPQTLPILAAFDNAPGFRLNVVMPSAGKDVVKRSRYTGLNVFGYSELGPSILARRADVAVFYGDAVPGERMAALAVDLMASGKPVVDCTQNASFQTSGAPVLRGPEELAALQNFLEFTVLVNADSIGREARLSPWLEARRLSKLEAEFGLAPPARPDPVAPDARVLFMPTNGNGLGHAQRCALIADEFEKPERASFAAFPTCVPLIKGRGFPCLPLVQKSPDFPEDYANDIVNYLRLRRTLSPADHLVFDGGYVFESIFRTIHETGCRATWIRRGLWRPGQISEAQIERERIFNRIILPGEAFEELNADYSQGHRMRRVGPIVQPTPGTDPAGVRTRLARMLGVEFDSLVVTMLGGGVAADRSAQLQRVCGLLARRPGCLHLIVVWPNSKIAPGIYGWENTHVVRTHNSLALCTAADFVVSAVGYNSFHELMYHRIPSIFVPQVAPYMDDQERRARAASDRDLAVTVLAHELLGLERAVSGMFAGQGAEIRQRLEALELPETGNRAAAGLIEEELCP